MLFDSAFFIFFEKDSNALSLESMQKLDRIYGIVSGNAAARLTLNGYTDSWGKPSYNQMVSELRANAVKSYLVGKGVDPSRMTAVGQGALALETRADDRELRELLKPIVHRESSAAVGWFRAKSTTPLAGRSSRCTTYTSPPRSRASSRSNDSSRDLSACVGMPAGLLTATKSGSL